LRFVEWSHKNKIYTTPLPIIQQINLKHILIALVLVNWKTLSTAIFPFPYTKYMYCILHNNTKCKSTRISTHNLYSKLYDKRKPLNYPIRFYPIFCSNVTIVTIINCWSQHNIWSSIEEFNYLGGQTTKSTNCYSGCVAVHWLRIRPNWVVKWLFLKDAWQKVWKNRGFRVCTLILLYKTPSCCAEAMLPCLKRLHVYATNYEAIQIQNIKFYWYFDIYLFMYECFIS